MSRFGDTPNFSQKSLCDSCRNSTVIKGKTYEEALTFCRLYGDNVSIHFPVVTCSSYDDKSQPSLYDMEKVAWRFSVDNKKKTAGFISGTEFRKKRRDEMGPGYDPYEE